MNQESNFTNDHVVLSLERYDELIFKERIADIPKEYAIILNSGSHYRQSNGCFIDNSFKVIKTDNEICEVFTKEIDRLKHIEEQHDLIKDMYDDTIKRLQYVKKMSIFEFIKWRNK